MLNSYNNILFKLKEQSHFRDIKNFDGKDEKYIYFNGKKLINLSSNNYLGFADNKFLCQRFVIKIGRASCRERVFYSV